jgi:hypothetical protein
LQGLKEDFSTVQTRKINRQERQGRQENLKKTWRSWRLGGE